MGSHSVTCHPTQVNASRLNPSRFTYPGGMEGWVYLGYPAMHRPGTELAISRSLVRRPTTTPTEQPKYSTTLFCWYKILDKQLKCHFFTSHKAVLVTLWWQISGYRYLKFSGWKTKLLIVKNMIVHIHQISLTPSGCFFFQILSGGSATLHRVKPNPPPYRLVLHHRNVVKVAPVCLPFATPVCQCDHFHLGNLG